MYNPSFKISKRFEYKLVSALGGHKMMVTPPLAINCLVQYGADTPIGFLG